MVGIDEIYLSPADAMAEYQRRQHLRPQIEQWFARRGLELPRFADIPQPAVLARHVGTAMFSDCVFAHVAEQAGFMPVWATYHGDTYVAVNTYKRALVQRVIVEGRGRAGGLKTRNHRLITHLPRIEKRTISEIQTDEGMPLVSFHRGLRPQHWHHIDLSDWLTSAGGIATRYYYPLLVLYLCHAVSFENFHEGGEDKEQADSFTSGVFLPAWKAVFAEFGLRPLIVRLPWHTSALHYPPSVDQWMETQVIESEFIERVNRGVA